METFKLYGFSQRLIFAIGLYIPLYAIAMEAPQFGGTIEIEGSYGLGAQSAQQSGDFSLATVELSVAQQFNQSIEANLLLLYEEEDSPFGVDQATIGITPFTSLPITVVVGKTVIPFGKFDSQLISDPLTLEMAETNRNSLHIEIGTDQLRTTLFAFNHNQNDSDLLVATNQSFGASAEINKEAFGVSMSYLHDLSATDILATNTKDIIPAIATGTYYRYGNTRFSAEYISALRRVEGDTFDSADFRPGAYQLELAIELEKILLTAGLQGTSQSAALGMPRQRMLIGSNMNLRNDIDVAIQLANEKSYARPNGNQLTLLTQLAVAF